MLLCPWVFNGAPQFPQFRLVLPAVFLAGIDAVAVAAGLLWRLARPFARSTVPAPSLRVRPALPAMVWAVPTVLAVLALAPRTLADYTAYFHTEYREAYLYFADMPGQAIYSYGLAPYFLVGRGNQHHVAYDLSRTKALIDDPSGLVRSLVDCVSPFSGTRQVGAIAAELVALRATSWRDDSGIRGPVADSRGQAALCAPG
jgi:hypothetical protein